ncbi:alpha/beta hydrolase [uncultured Clostridium sp.]|uniref:alpha/beta hydrolase n=1 Tax=uncultured Clostridium sp. TaxID=59620 RepID=UPI0028E58784|nr:alpha/beta hydrolase [uncultured Clostridium sp.]
MIEEKIISFKTTNQIGLNMNLYKSNINKKDITILYLHGGGLLYGVRDDLPRIYIDKFLDAGYDILALDYPLAPESKLDTILSSTYEGITYYLNNYKQVFNLNSNKFILFGRSAGSYLAFMMCNMLIKNNNLLPLSIISLYGYTRLDEVEFNTPSKYYNKLPKVTDESINRIISNEPVTYGPMNERFSLYIKARQEGNWIEALCNKENILNYSIDDEALKSFPPTILAAATSDPDVPYRISKKISRIIPNSTLITIYEEEHDFDRDIKNNSGKEAYDKIISWLNSKIIK